MNALTTAQLISPVPDFYCEVRSLTGGLARPGYAISDLAMFAVALFILYRYGNRWSGRLVGIAMIFMSLFSYLYDVHQTQFTRLLDHLGIFNMFIVFAVLNLSLVIPKRKVYFAAILMWVSVYAVSLLNALYGGELLQPIFAVLVVGLVILEYEVYLRLGKNYERGSWALAIVLLFAGLFWQFVDSSGAWCAAPGAEIFNGRALYHYLAAAAIYFMLRHYLGNQLSGAKP